MAFAASLTSPMLTLAVAAAPEAAGGEGGGADALISPLLILILCVLAGLGTILLLPGGYRPSWRRAGGALAAVAGIALFLAAGVASESRPVVYFWIFSAIALFGSLRVITHPRPVYSALYFVLTVFATAGLFVLMWAEFMAVALVVIYAGAILVTYTFVIMLAAEAAPAGVAGDEAARDFLAEHDRKARNPWGAATIGFVTMGVLLFVIFDRAPGTLVPRQSVIEPQYLQRVPAPADPRGADAEARALASAAQPERSAPAATRPAATRPGRVVPKREEARASAIPIDPAKRQGDLYPANDMPSHANERGGVQALGIYLFTRQMVALQLAGLILTIAMVGAIVIARKQVIVDPRTIAQGVGLTTHDHGGEIHTAQFTPANDDPKSLPVKGTGDPRQKAYPQN